MPTKPTVKPQWAENDVVDPTSGQNNVAEPPLAKKTDGIDFEEIIPRQWQNWLQRIIYRWVDWFDGTTIPLSSDVGTSNEQLSDGTGHTHALNGASQAEAEAGADNTKVMTPLRTVQAISESLIDRAVGYIVNEDFSAYSGVSQEIESFGPLNARGIFFKPDGLNLYVVSANDDTVYDLSLSSAWDITTISANDTFSVAAQETAPTGIFFKPDGTEMYVTGIVSENINQYTLSTAWDISTASFTSLFNVTAQDGGPADVIFKPDGTEMYMMGGVTNTIYQYALSTAWDVTTAVLSGSFSTASEDGVCLGIRLKPTGRNLFVVGGGNDKVYEYLLSTDWDITTATLRQSFDISIDGTITLPQAIEFKRNGTSLIVLDVTGALDESLYEYHTNVLRLSS